MRKIATENEISGFIINSKSTSHAIAYDSYIEKSGNEKVDFESFKTFVPENHLTVEEMTKKVEEVLKSQKNVNSPDFKISEDPEVQKEKDRVLEEADKNDDQKVTICHIPPGNPGNRHTITISESALQTHLNHGDGVGVCPIEVIDGTAPIGSSTSSTSTTSTSSTSTTTGSTPTSSSSSTTTTTGTQADSTPGAVLAINGGANYTNSTSVTLNLSNIVGVGVLSMSTDGGSTWEALNMAKPYSLAPGDGTKTVTVILKDENGVQSEPLNDSIILDTVNPSGTLANIQATSTFSTGATISWNTLSEATLSEVQYGISTTSMTLSTLGNTLVSTHTFNLTGLNASTTYYYQVVSKDSAGNQLASGPFSFQTPFPGQIWNLETQNAAFPARRHHSTVVFNGKMFVIAGRDPTGKNDVWASSNGVNWEQVTLSAPFSQRFYHTSLVFNEKIFVIGGATQAGDYKSDVIFSSDGLNWSVATTTAAFGQRALHSSVLFNNKMWLIAGTDAGLNNRNDVWYSTDGILWLEATASASFPPRADHSSIVFDNKMWIIGGATGPKQDVWFSSDGTNWNVATTSASFGGRQAPECVSFQNKMWLVAGFDGGGLTTNDVWYSVDGIDWRLATPNSGFPKREAHSALVFQDKIWVIAGLGTINFNDVWSSK